MGVLVKHRSDTKKEAQSHSWKKRCSLSQSSAVVPRNSKLGISTNIYGGFAMSESTIQEFLSLLAFSTSGIWTARLTRLAFIRRMRVPSCPGTPTDAARRRMVKGGRAFRVGGAVVAMSLCLGLLAVPMQSQVRQPAPVRPVAPPGSVSSTQAQTLQRGPSPANVSAKVASPTSVVVTWQAPNQQPGVAYVVVRNSAVLNRAPITQTVYTDTTVRPGIEYSYKVVAVFPHAAFLPGTGPEVSVRMPGTINSIKSAVMPALQIQPLPRPPFTSGQNVGLNVGLSLGSNLGAAHIQVPHVFGFADLHVHQFANYGFGGVLVWGRPAPMVVRDWEPQLWQQKTGGRLTAPPSMYSGKPLWELASCACTGDVTPLQFAAFNPPFSCFQLGNNPTPTPAHGPGGTSDLIGSLALDWPNSFGHDTEGGLDFAGWPYWDEVNHQHVHYLMLKRAHDAGLNLMVMDAVNNELLCNASNRWLSCDDKSALDRQISAAWAMQDYIDCVSAGGVMNPPKPGETIPYCSVAPVRGWYRIVTNPRDARQAINNGQLAVVLGVEVDRLLDCGIHDPACTDQDIWSRLEDLHGKGVRVLYPVHLVDNQFGGAAMYNDLFNYENLVMNGDWFAGEPCPAIANSAQQITYTFGKEPDEAKYLASKFTTLLAVVPPGTFRYAQNLASKLSSPPAYAGGFQGQDAGKGVCNSRTLQPAGQTLIKAMMSNHMIIDVDHMSRLMANAVLDIAQRNQYPVMTGHIGVLELAAGNRASENFRTRDQLATIARLGGIIGVGLDESNTQFLISDHGGTRELEGPHGAVVKNDCGRSDKTWAQVYQYASAFFPGVAVGSDLNGLNPQMGPRYGHDACDHHKDFGDGAEGDQSNRPMVQYPFTIPARTGSSSFSNFALGSRKYDFNYDGFAHAGMYPDFIADLRNIGLTPTAQGDPLTNFFNSTEMFLEMWEKIDPPIPVLKAVATQIQQSPLTLRVTVTDGGTNQPVAQANVAIYEYQGLYASGVTGPDGTVTLEYKSCYTTLSLPTPGCDVVVTKTGSAPLRFKSPALAATAASQGSTLKITVKDQANAPAPGATVSCSDSQGRQQASGVTISDGTVQLPSKCGGWGTTLTANKTGYLGCSLAVPGMFGTTSCP